MDLSKWLLIDGSQILGIVVTAVGAYVGLMAFTRLIGLRSFSKLSSHDFAMTVAVGSILASTVVSKSPAMLQGIVAIGTLFGLQALVSFLRRKSKWVQGMVDNTPVVLMAHGEYYWDNIAKASLSKCDIQAVIRKNGIMSKSQIFAVVMETTGDMSVIKQSDAQPDLDLFDDIRECEILVKRKRA